MFIEIWDQDDYLVYANPAARRLYPGRPEGPLHFADMMRWCHRAGVGLRIETDNIEAWLQSVMSRRAKQKFRQFASDFHCGTWMLLSEVMLPNGWMLAPGYDITALKQKEEVLITAHENALQAARTDGLTNLPNRRYTMELAGRALEERGAAPASMIVLDLDHFKRINDAYGHVAGDQVLRHFAHHCSSMLRRSDIVGRIGGEEFLIFMPDTGGRDARLVMLRIRQALQACMTGAAGEPIRYSFSAGLASAREGETLDELYLRADHYLYAAKRQGRDLVMGEGLLDLSPNQDKI